MTTVGELLDITVRQHLEMAGPTGVNRLQSAVATTDETIVLDWQPDPEPAPGQYIEVGSEVMLVLASQGVTLDVARGQWGTAAIPHRALATIRIQPRFVRPQIITELQDEIRSWPRTLYGVSRTEVTYGEEGVDLDAATGKDVIRVLRAWCMTSSGPWLDVTDSVDIFPTASADYPSGWQLRFRGGALVGETLEVTYAHGLTVDELFEYTDLNDDVGLSSSMLDIARYGTAARLLYSQEGERARLDVQNQRRFAEEVPPQHQMTAAEGLMKIRDKRLQDEEERLISHWGVS